jgi:integrase
MRSLRKDGLAMPTINGYVTKLRAFWNWCAKKGIVELFPTIEDFPEPQSIPEAYDQEEFQRLIAATKLMQGEVMGLKASEWWYALHLVAFDSGERSSALLNLRWAHYDEGDATLAVPAEIRKGGRKPMLYRLKPSTVKALRRLQRPGAKIVFPWPGHIGTFYNHYRKLLDLAGLPYVSHKSGLQKVRRTFASHIEAAGGNATQALSHTSRRVTEKSYIDPRIAKEPSHNDLLFDVGDS